MSSIKPKNIQLIIIHSTFCLIRKKNHTGKEHIVKKYPFYLLCLNGDKLIVVPVLLGISSMYAETAHT